MMRRRDFLKATALTAAPLLLPVGSGGWAAAAAQPGGKRLVVVFLRGAVDGLNVVVPYADAGYYQARRSIAIQRPGGEAGALDLDGRFGLHPALVPLMPLWKQGSLAFVHACGSPDPSRSHFDAQHFMETGTPGVATTPDGWMNRLLGVLPGPHSPTQAIALGPTLPDILKGKVSVANMPLAKGGVRPAPLDKPQVAEAFGSMYSGNDSMSQAFHQGQDARKEVMASLAEEMKEADNGAPAPNGFPGDAKRLARLMSQDPRIQLAFMAVGGWDTHVNQGGVQGQLAGRLRPLGEGLAALAGGLGPAYQDTVIVVMSEFGRTVRENGNGGTDHGHGNVMWIAGGAVRGGHVYGNWPGLSTERLFQGRDLAVTTDFRSVLGVVAERHLRLGPQQLKAVLPLNPPNGRLVTLIKA